ncbi:MAG: hypothetical protein JXJ04_14505 [Spirochaetales bacterium]|nr:hypothetical protein [Spirochaetales bacterium]
MKKIFLLISLIFLYSGILFAGTTIFRYGIFVSSSKGYNEITLTHANREVREVARLFKEYCRLNDYCFMEDPGRIELNSAFDQAAQKIANLNDVYETQLFFYYYGHGLPEGLLLGNELYGKAELKEQLSFIDTRVKFIFLDACSAEVMGTGDALDFRTQSEGTAFITSSGLFEQSFADIFTPILKAGIMGDADGFIPPQFAASFFYNEIITKLKGAERSFVRDLYDFKESYDFLSVSPQQELEVKHIFNSLGIEEIPPRLDFTRLSIELLPELKNNLEKKLIQSVYNYDDVCYLDKKLSSYEKKQLISILEKIGFKKDNFVTLVELFSYIRFRVTEKEILRQTPTINTNYLSRKEPVRLSYTENKIGVILKYPGTIFVNRVTDENLLDLLVTLTPRLGDDVPTRITLSPGKYTFFLKIDDVKYGLDMELSPGDDDIVLDPADKTSRVLYRVKDVDERDFFSYGAGISGSQSLVNNTSLKMGIMPTISFQYNFNFTWGIIGLGIITGLNWQTTKDDVTVAFDYLYWPLVINGRFTTKFSLPYFLYLDLGAGYAREQIFLGTSAGANDWGSRFYMSAGIGGGVNLSKNMSLALNTHIAGAVHSADNYYILLLPGLEFLNKF